MLTFKRQFKLLFHHKTSWQQLQLITTSSTQLMVKMMVLDQSSALLHLEGLVLNAN